MVVIVVILKTDLSREAKKENTRPKRHNSTTKHYVIIAKENNWPATVDFINPILGKKGACVFGR